MAKMIGQFDLKDGQTIEEYKYSFDNFCEHLKEEGFVESWGVYERRPYKNYDTNAPEQPMFVEMNFWDHAQAKACWDYVEECEGNNTQPLCSLHRDMNSRIQNGIFVLYQNCD